MVYKLPSLSYSYSALEPFFDKETMEIHYTKHHQNYVNNTNLIIDKINLKNISINELLSMIDVIPLSTSQRNFLRNNAGGHANHSFFWKILKKNTQPNNIIKEAIVKSFGSFKKFQKIFENIATNFFGSGWIWLIKKNNILSIVTTKNQYNPLMGKNINGFFGYPLIALDLWEHAYYLKYQNQRSLYIKAFWNVLNWDEVQNLFLKSEI
ncbi:Fe-Mn family superoxide dismutase [Enterobacteriaceae endosymbiont of Plateumaris braccata]|uniref:Fe-Mn family superoxide dismutase n=1 Tax=Enterobacteriaceae endosymbiont of Plateumaris braccata TaxID=2675793 RepID=UPI001448D604|nr:Fe-Mn family superoxide dismutase [Enterobacteriaceae endosymbiont of Plateumaris braccata]QJC28208.1 superoxide dismutase [Mn] [Enterobacteriaceae endosymbiont of Plateumaris braccata]